MTGRPSSPRARSEARALAVVLPKGVSHAHWKREMGRWQNPRIRAFLGCLRLLRDCLESNFAILHCSPTRLMELFARVRQVADLLRGDVALLLDGRSQIPELDSSREAVQANLRHLEQTLLRELDSFPEQLPDHRHDDARRFLCVAVGQLHRFLQDSFGSLMASDPRARHDADYYLSKQFPRDVEEAEWLYDSVTRLEGVLRAYGVERETLLAEMLQRLIREQRIPPRAEWTDVAGFLDRLVNDLTPKLKDVTALKGIRMEELELITQYATEIQTVSRIVSELYESSVDALNNLQVAGEPTPLPNRPRQPADTLHFVLCERLTPQLRALEDYLRDLAIFVPLWRRGVSQRRALLLNQTGEAEANRAGS